MARTFEFEQIRLIIISAFSSLLAILTPTEGFVVALIIGFGFNIFCGMRADGISISRCKNFSWNKAQKAIFELTLYFTIVYVIYSIVYACGDKKEAIFAAKILTYIFDYAYVCNGFKNLIIAYPKNVIFRVIYHLIRFEIMKALPGYWKPIIDRLNNEFDKQDNKSFGNAKREEWFKKKYKIMDKILMLLLNLWSKGYTLNSQTILDSIKLMKLWLTKI